MIRRLATARLKASFRIEYCKTYGFDKITKLMHKYPLVKLKQYKKNELYKIKGKIEECVGAKSSTDSRPKPWQS